MGKFINPFTDMPWAAQNAVFQRLAEVAEVSKLSKEDRMAYDHALKRYRDTYNAMTGAEQKVVQKVVPRGNVTRLWMLPRT